MNRRPLLILLAVLSLLGACKKDSDSPPPIPPETEPLAIAAAKPGDTLFIKGEHFSTEIAKNTVKFNGVEATVVTASDTELKVLVPANATTGPVTVTVNGQTTEVVSSFIINPFTVYVVKSNYQGQETVRQIVSIDPANGTETLVATLDGTEDDKMNDMVYLPATNELIGNNWGTGILKINLATKQKTVVEFDLGQDMDMRELVVDKYSNLYGVKRDFTDMAHYKHVLVKIDPKTGDYTVIKSFEYAPYWESLVYLASTNEVIGLANSNKAIFKLNLTTKDTSTVALSGANDIEYRELVIDNQSNLYSYKGDYSDPDNYIGQIVKINPANGQETLLKTIAEYGKLHDNLIYVPSRNELIGVWEQTGLYRLNLGTKAGNVLPFTSQQDITYGDITSN